MLRLFKAAPKRPTQGEEWALRSLHETEAEPFARFELRAKVSQCAHSECFIGCRVGVAGIEQYYFIRKVHHRTAEDLQIQLLPWAQHNSPSVEPIFETGVERGQAYVASGLLWAIGLDRLARQIRLPWSLSLALLEGAAERFDVGFLKDNLPRFEQLFLSPAGELFLGYPRRAPHAPCDQDPLLRLIGLFVRLTLGPKHPALELLGQIRALEELSVFTDHLLEISPNQNAHSELLVPYFQSWATGEPNAQKRRELIEFNTPDFLLSSFWNIVQSNYQKKLSAFQEMRPPAAEH